MQKLHCAPESRDNEFRQWRREFNSAQNTSTKTRVLLPNPLTSCWHYLRDKINLAASFQPEFWIAEVITGVVPMASPHDGPGTHRHLPRSQAQAHAAGVVICHFERACLFCRSGRILWMRCLASALRCLLRILWMKFLTSALRYLLGVLVIRFSSIASLIFEGFFVNDICLCLSWLRVY